MGPTESMKFLVLLACVGLALSAPFPQVVLPYGAVGGYPYGLSYGGAPIVAYNALNSGLVYPVAEAYVHDPSGDAADDPPPLPPPMSMMPQVTLLMPPPLTLLLMFMMLQEMLPRPMCTMLLEMHKL